MPMSTIKPKWMKQVVCIIKFIKIGSWNIFRIHFFLTVNFIIFIDGFVSLSTEESGAMSSGTDGEQYDQSEFLYIKLKDNIDYDLKIEHFDDLIQDNSFQSSWAGLDSTLIDEDFLYLEDDEADKIYSQLKARQFRRKNIEETEQRFQAKMRAFEEMAKT